MNHSFTASAADATKCRCGYEEIDHTDRATCESCGRTGKCEIVWGKLLLCEECTAKERATESNKPPGVYETPTANPILEIAKAIDTTVKIRTDLHNAETVAIIDLKRSIDEDDGITDKHFALSICLDEKYKKYSDVIFSAREEIVKAESAQRAIQTYYNDLSKKLSAEKKAQIKLKDVTYQPVEPKVVKPKSPKVTVNKLELKKLCEEYGVPEYIVSVVILQKGMSIIDAVKHVKRTLPV